MGWKIPRLSRRTFLKSAAGGTGLSLLSPIGGVFSKAAGKDPIETETSHSICNFCSSLCNLKVTTENRGRRKRIVKLAGNPASTLNRGKLCARGQSGLRQRLWREHLGKWLPAFAADLRNHSRLQIYRSWGDRLSLLCATTEKETAYA
ncbi:MAG: hypothetical protein KZQ88_06340 [Candidatus Thiodiazotropha sp. (ex Dulcina madagascariensis)]|nr:hypothetical protein [Candidatus Thiodiazotropha sp. (ex Dulcina madagascariensis)]MCU7928975.1 hypothetical protein [Candidatus Thiodiazotropha sp. (ex Dulcina madagascariensis)]